MLKFDPIQYLSVQNGAVSLAKPIDDAIGREFDLGMRRIAFWGVGGVAFLNMPAARLLQTQSSFPTYVDMGAEVIHSGNVNVGPGTLVVFTSVSGTTKEAITALEYAKSRGARVLTLTGVKDSPLSKLADVNFFNECADPTSSENFYIQTLLVALSVMRRADQYPHYDRVVSELEKLPPQLVRVKEQFEERAAAFAEEIKGEQHHIVTGSGNAWFEAWYYAMCILEEMQWIWTRPIHASDFFHGTLELLEADTSIWILKGEDSARVLAERVERFAKTVSNKVRVFDTKDFDLAGLSDDVRALVSPIVFAAAFQRLSTHLERVRDHALTTRRYYKKGDF